MSEAREYLQVLNTCLLDLEENPGNLNLIDQMFRAAHSLKGMAGTMGYGQIASLTHHLESVLGELKQENLKPEISLINVLFDSVDVLEDLLEEIDGETGKTIDITMLVNQLNSYSSAEDTNKTDEEDTFPDIDLKGKVEKGGEVCLVTVELEESCQIKSVRAYMILNELKTLGTVIETSPDEESLQQGVFANSFQVVIKRSENIKAIEEKVSSVTEVESVTVKEYNFVEEKEDKKEEEKQEIAEELDSEESDKQTEANQAFQEKKKEKIIRVETDKLDQLVGDAGELVVNRTRIFDLSKSIQDPELQVALQQLDMITTNLQNTVMKLRMVAIKQVFDRFPRLVRDLSKESGKKIELVIEGEDTELDRSIINVIGEPLVHLVKNAIDHGIEDTEERKHLQKSEKAFLKLSACHEGSHVIVEIQDDGRGIDAEKIKEKALEKEIKTEDELKKMSEKEIVRLVFHKGFSTAQKVTDVSGRGVGMDVVTSVVESLHGEVDIETELDKGTKFIVKLPLTLAIIRAMLIRVGAETYAIPIESIWENISISVKDTYKVQQQPVFTFRDEVLPLMMLRDTLNCKDKGEEKKNYPVVVVKAGDKKAGLVVDELIGQQEIVIKSLGKLFDFLNYVAGATILANGEVALILDVSNLIS